MGAFPVKWKAEIMAQQCDISAINEAGISTEGCKTRESVSLSCKVSAHTSRIYCLGHKITFRRG